jgi:hypothetical protein
MEQTMMGDGAVPIYYYRFNFWDGRQVRQCCQVKTVNSQKNDRQRDHFWLTRSVT